jgi:hypothetical protein
MSKHHKEQTEIEIMAESKGAEAYHQAAVLAQAEAEALDKRMEAAFDRSFKKAFTLDDGVTRRFVDVSRANLICQTIVAVEKRLKAIEANLTWGVRLVIGAVIVALLTMILKK